MPKNNRGNNGHNYTDIEIGIIMAAYSENVGNKKGWLEELSRLIDRPKTNICRYARLHGLTDRMRGLHKPLTQIICLVCEGSTTNRKYCSKKCSDVGAGLTRRGRKLWANRPHPRGMLGKTHTPAYRAQIALRVSNQWKDPNSTFNSTEFRNKRSIITSANMVKRISENPSSIYSRTHKGWAEFSSGKKYFLRSGWELRYANYLEMLLKGRAILDWQYEVDTFWFEKIRRGVRSYTPDFKVFFKDGSIEYHEVKGWMDPKSKTKLNRMRIYYPNIKVIVIDKEGMKNI